MHCHATYMSHIKLYLGVDQDNARQCLTDCNGMRSWCCLYCIGCDLQVSVPSCTHLSLQCSVVMYIHVDHAITSVVWLCHWFAWLWSPLMPSCSHRQARSDFEMVWNQFRMFGLKPLWHELVRTRSSHHVCWNWFALKGTFLLALIDCNVVQPLYC